MEGQNGAKKKAKNKRNKKGIVARSEEQPVAEQIEKEFQEETEPTKNHKTKELQRQLDTKVNQPFPTINVDEKVYKNEALTYHIENTNMPQKISERHSKYLDVTDVRGGGSKLSDHGGYYQLHILMLFLWRAYKQYKQYKQYQTYRLGAEVDGIQKLDDVILQYQDNENENLQLRLVQVKHTEDNENKYITKRNFFYNEKNKDYDIKKEKNKDYIISLYVHGYFKIKAECNGRCMYSILPGSEIKDLIICTNYDLHKDIKSYFEELDLDNDDILKLNVDLKANNPNTTFYKFKDIKNNDIIRELKEEIKKTSDFRKLIDEIASWITGEKTLTNSPVVNHYFYTLTRSVFSIDKTNNYAKFLPEFIKGANMTVHFRDALLEKLKELHVDVNLETEQFHIQDNLAKRFIPAENPEIESKLAEKIADLFKSEKKIIHITKETYDKSEVQKLAGYILVNYFGKKKFSTNFWTGDELPHNLKKFRIRLKEFLGEEVFSTLYEYNIQIDDTDFRTCDDGALYRKLPASYKDYEVDEFFEKFRILVNYPSAGDIYKLISKEMKTEYRSLNVAENNSNFKLELDDWLRKRNANFYTPEETKNLFDSINKKIICVQMEGITKEYFSSASKNYEFNKYDCIIKFLQNEGKQIYRLIFKDLNLGRIRVVQSFQYLKNMRDDDPTKNDYEKIKRYIDEYSGIFRTVKQLDDNVVYCFNHCEMFNLLVIECDTECVDVNVVDRLYTVVYENSDKKIIFITQEIYNLPKKITDFKYTNSTKKITEFEYIDKSNFNDLEVNSQNKLLQEKVVNFQGQDITLKELNENVADFIDSDVLSELLKDEKIILDSDKPANLDDIREYFIYRKYDLDIKLELDLDVIKKNTSDLFYISNIKEEEAQKLCNNSLSDKDLIQFPNSILYLLMICHDHKETRSDSKLEAMSTGTIYYSYKDHEKNQKQFYIINCNKYNKLVFDVDSIRMAYNFFSYFSDLKEKYTKEELNVLFIIYTSSAFLSSNSAIVEIEQITENEKLREMNDLLDFENHRVSDQQYESFQLYFVILEIAEALVKFIFESPEFGYPLDQIIFKKVHFINIIRYYFQLKEEIIDFESRNFFYAFIKNNTSLSERVRKFREVVLNIIRNRFHYQKWSQTEEEICFELYYNLHIPFVSKFRNDYDPEFEDINIFTEKFVECLKNGTENKLIGIKLDRSIFGDDIDLLELHVLVLTDPKDDTVKFSSSFLDTDNPQLLPINLEHFRDLLKKELQKDGINFSELKDYKFEIQDFETCLDRNYCLPIELISEFFERLVVKVNQPDTDNLKYVVKGKLGDSYDSVRETISNYLRVDSAYEFIFNRHLIFNFFLKKIREFHLDTDKFCLARNLKTFKYFNDVVFKYVDREAQKKQIFIHEFLGENNIIDSRYYFRCLFNWYYAIMKIFELDNEAKKYFFVYTTANFDFDDLKLKKINFEEVKKIEDILDIRDAVPSAKYFRLIFNKQNKICRNIIKTTELYDKASYLVHAIYSGSVIQHDKFEALLIVEVIDVVNNKLHNNFINNKLVSKTAKTFREYFVYAYRNFINDDDTPEQELLNQLQEVELSLALNFEIFSNDTFEFICDVILKNQKLYDLENVDENKVICKVKILNNIKSYTISLTLFEQFSPYKLRIKFRRRDEPAYISFKKLLQNRNSLHEEYSKHLNETSYTPYMGMDLKLFCDNLLFVQCPTKCRRDTILTNEVVYNSTKGYNLLKQYKYVNNISLDDVDSFYESKISPGVGRFVKEEKKPAQIEKKPAQIEKKPAQIILSTNTNDVDETNLKTRYPHHTIHFLKNENNKFVWQSSQGPIDNLRNFIKDTRKDIEVKEIDDRIGCIAAKSGMGKSTILKYLSEEIKKKSRCTWVLKIDLRSCQKQLAIKDWKFTTDEIIEFLYSVAGLKNEFEKKFLRFLFKLKNMKYCYIVLLLDGFDEIEDKNKQKVLTLLKTLKNYNIVKLWITTRLHLKNEIEDALSVISYNLKSFTKWDQIHFLNQFWEQECEHNKITDKDTVLINKYVKNLISSFKKATSTKERDFLGIPLQCRMVAEALNKNFLEFYNKYDKLQHDQIDFCLPKNIDLLYVYKSVIANKYEIFFDKYVNKIPDGSSDISDTLRNCYDKLHQNLALKYLKIDEFGVYVLPKPTEENQLIRIAIVHSQNNELDFIHPTFAEYFVAEHLAEILINNKNDEMYQKVLKFLEKEFFNEKRKVIIEFLDRILADEHEILNAALNNNTQFFKDALNNATDNKFKESMTSTADALGRRALHLAAAYNSIEVLKSLPYGGADVKIRDKFLKWTPIVYSVQNSNWDIAELLLEDSDLDDIKEVKDVKSVDQAGTTLLHFAAKHTNVDIVGNLLKRHADINASDKKGLTPIFYAIQGNKLDIVKHLVSEYADVNHADQEGLTPIFHAIDTNNMAIIKCLVEKADLNFKNIYGLDPVSYANQHNKVDIAKLLTKPR